MYSPRRGVFAERNTAKLHNVSSKGRFAENIEIMPELRFTGYSMNTLNYNYLLQ